MIEYLRVFGRAFAIVVLTAANVRFIAAGHVLLMFVTGCGISWVWWTNTQTAASTRRRGAGLAYGLGAGCGTVVGWWAAGVLAYALGHL